MHIQSINYDVIKLTKCLHNWPYAGRILRANNGNCFRFRVTNCWTNSRVVIYLIGMTPMWRNYDGTPKQSCLDWLWMMIFPQIVPTRHVANIIHGSYIMGNCTIESRQNLSYIKNITQSKLWHGSACFGIKITSKRRSQWCVLGWRYDMKNTFLIIDPIAGRNPSQWPTNADLYVTMLCRDSSNWYFIQHPSII